MSYLVIYNTPEGIQYYLISEELHKQYKSDMELIHGMVINSRECTGSQIQTWDKIQSLICGYEIKVKNLPSTKINGVYMIDWEF